MKIRGLTILAISCIVWLVSWMWMPQALALTQIELHDLSYQRCPYALGRGAVSSGSMIEASCFLVTGKAENRSGKPVYDADVFGRIYDANNNPVLQNRSRLGAIEEVPPGTSDFELRISVPANMPAPLQLKQFKASGFSGKIRR